MSDPVLRTDNIGALASSLAGGAEHPPNWSAAVPLFDALMEEGDVAMAMRLRQEVGSALSMLASFGPDYTDPRVRNQILQNMQGSLLNLLTPLIYDFGSMCGHLAGVVEKLIHREELKSGKVELNTVRTQVAEFIRIGSRVSLDNDRFGLVVSERDVQGMADVMLLEGEALYADGPMQAGAPPMPGLFQNRFVRGTRG